MRKVVFLCVITALIAACSSGPKYVINGDIEGSDSLTFLLQKREAGKIINIDSAVSKKGRFKMEGTVSFPDMVQLAAKGTDKRGTFFLENSEISLKGTIDSLYVIKVTGSKSQDEYNSLRDLNKPLSEKYSNLYIQYQGAIQTNNTEKATQLEKEADAIEEEMQMLQINFVKNNPSSFVSPSILRGLMYKLEAAEIETYINAMDTAVSNIPMMKDIKERVAIMKTVAIGQKAPDFTMADVNGNPVALSSKTGTKLLLIDFWAAWCSPCRQENPNVVKVYNEFHKKGFDVFGVSLDSKKDAWLAAIDNDKLTWTHVSDLQYWSNAAAKLYAVNSIPANFLLDETGKIIARNLRGDDLYNKVKEVLGEK